MSILNKTYRVVYTELVIHEATFEGPEDMDEGDCLEYLEADENSQVKRLDTVECQVSLLEEVT